MKKIISVLFLWLMFTNLGKCQYSLLAKLDNENAFNSIVLGTLKSSFNNQLEGEQPTKNAENIECRYVGERKDYFNVFGIQFRLLVMEFDKLGRLVGFRLSQRYLKDQESLCSSEYKFLCEKLLSIYGQYNSIPYSNSGSINGKMWIGENVELGVLTLDVETFGSKQLTISVRSLELDLDNRIKNLNQNISVLDNITGFENYKFGKTMQDYDCDSWLCQKKPQNYYVGNNLVESINLNFSANSLYAIVIIFKTNDQILETLTKKYGPPLKETVNELAYQNVEKYFWRSNTVGIEYYFDNGKYYLHYYKTTKKGLNEL